MNRECHANTFHLDGKLYVRCIWDGTIVKVDSLPERCPACKRLLHPQHVASVSTRVMRQVYLSAFDMWFDLEVISL